MAHPIRSCLIAGCARNVEPHLPAVLANALKIAAQFDQATFFFVENNSTDQTLARLKEFSLAHPNVHVQSLGDLDAPMAPRTVRLAFVRNFILSKIAATPAMSACDELVLLDLDEVNSEPLDVNAIQNALAFLRERPQTAGVFANQPVGYWDIWALRHPQLMPVDCWHAVFDRVERLAETDQQAFEALLGPTLPRFQPSEPPIEVQSAFGGLGFYKMPVVLANPMPYVGSATRFFFTGPTPGYRNLQTCEHVSFHLGLRAMGQQLFIYPALVNKHQALNVNPSFFRSIAF